MTTNLAYGMHTRPMSPCRGLCAALPALVGCLLMILALALPFRAWAADASGEAGSSFDPERTGSITVTLLDSASDGAAAPVSGGTVALYRVASVAATGDGSLAYAACAGFAESGISLADVSETDLANRLASWALSDAGSALVSPQAASTPDAEGTVVFANLECGLYLVCQTQASPGHYAVKPFVVELPSGNIDRASWVYDVSASPKVEPNPNDTITTSVTVTKVWCELASDGSAVAAAPTARHDAVTVLLLVGGSEYARAELSAANGWSYTWQDVPGGVELAVQEADVPLGYTVSYSRSGNDADGHAFTVTNTAQARKLIQTGQLNWPVPVLALAGVVLFALGWRRSRRAAPVPEKDAPDGR